MKTMRELHLLGVLAVLLVAVVFFTPAAAEARPTIHALVMVGGDIRREAEDRINKEKIANLLYEIEDAKVCNVKLTYLLYGNDNYRDRPTPDRILEWIKTVRPHPDDVMFIYYTGDGGVNLETEHLYLRLIGNIKYPRDNIGNALNAKACRLKIFLTEVCRWTGVERRIAVVHGHGGFLDETTLHDLFVKHEGFLNVTAATEGEFAWGWFNHGGWFTTSFVSAIYRPWIDDGDGFLSWKEMFNETRRLTMAAFKSTYASHSSREFKYDLADRNQTTQRPKYYGELPKRIQ